MYPPLPPPAPPIVIIGIGTSCGNSTIGSSGWNSRKLRDGIDTPVGAVTVRVLGFILISLAGDNDNVSGSLLIPFKGILTPRLMSFGCCNG